MAYQDWGWRGVANLLTVMQVMALAIALRLSFLQPLGSPSGERR
jgi:hypothetical protein